MLLRLLLALNAATAMTVIPNNAPRNVHLNNAGDSPSPPEVTDAVSRHMALESEVGGYRAAELAGARVDGVYASAARLIGAGPRRDEGDAGGGGAGAYDARDEIALVESATVGWTRFFYAALETKERELPVRRKEVFEGSGTEKGERIILVSEAEYAANLVAAVKFARDHSTQHSRFRWRVLPIPSSFEDGKEGAKISSGVVDLEALRSILEGTYELGGAGRQTLDPASIAMVCITHIPTNSGIINPANEIGAMIHEFNSRGGDEPRDATLPQILYLVDACQSVGQIAVDASDMKCHALAATGRKYLRGPRGTGFLYVQRRIANMLEPSHVDHAAAPVAKVMDQTSWEQGLEEEGELGLSHTYKPGAARFEFWEANVAARLGLGAAMEASLAFGTDAIEERCAVLGRALRSRLRAMEGVDVYHDGASVCGIVTFSSERLGAAEIKERLQNGASGGDVGDPAHPACRFHLSIVPATSTPLDSSRTGLGERALVRASASYFNTEDEIEMFCKALEKVLCKI